MMEGRGESMNLPRYWFLLLVVLVLGCARNAPSARIYDEKADAHHDIAAAIASAAPAGKNIVLIFGANW